MEIVIAIGLLFAVGALTMAGHWLVSTLTAEELKRMDDEHETFMAPVRRMIDRAEAEAE